MREVKNSKDFQAIIQQEKPVLLDFYADWCPPCKALLPTVEKLAATYKDDFVITKINIDKHPDLASQFKVRSIPALFIIKGKEIQEQLLGYQSEKVLDDVIQKHLVTS